MSEKLLLGDCAGCPISEIHSHAIVVRRRCHELFGVPNLELKNNLGGVDGKFIVSFLQDLRSINFPDELCDFGSMASAPIVGFKKPSDKADIKLLSSVVKDYRMTKLACIMYTLFCQNFKGDAADREAFYGLSFELFQAFDSVLITGVRSVDTLEAWGKLREPMLGILVNLSQIPTNIQSSLLKVGEHDSYNVENMLDTFNSLRVKFNGLNKWMKENAGGYGICPAAKDGSMLEAYHLLFDIYGKAFFSE